MDESYVFPPPLSLLCPPSSRISDSTCLPTFSCLKEEVPPSPSCSINTTISNSSNTSLSTPNVFQTSFGQNQLSEMNNNNNKKEKMEIIIDPFTRDCQDFNNTKDWSNKGSTFSIFKSLRIEELSSEKLIQFQSLSKKLWEETDSNLSMLCEFDFYLPDTSPQKHQQQKMNKSASLPTFNKNNNFITNSYQLSRAEIPIKSPLIGNDISTHTLTKSQRSNRNQQSNKRWAHLVRTYKSKLKSSSDTWTTDGENITKLSHANINRPISPSPNLDGTTNEDAFSSWGGMALALWGEECLKLEDLISGKIKETGIRLNDEDTIAQLRNWNLFYTTYRLGLLNLSEMPPLPNGVPEFECCPDATPTSLGVLYAPIPEWESVRLQTFHRMEILKQDQSIREKIMDLLKEFKDSLPIHQNQKKKDFEIILRFIGQDEIFRQTKNAILREETLRRQSICSHTILNRNMGMQINDFCADWRFALPEEDLVNYYDYQDSYQLSSSFGKYKFDLLLQEYRSYIGMPILAADGLPMGVLSIWGLYPSFKNCQLNNLTRQYARKIGACLEQNYCLKFISKVQQMRRICQSIPRYILQQPHQHQQSPHHKRIGSGMITEALQLNQKNKPSFPVQTFFDEKVCLESGLYINSEDYDKLFSTFEQLENVTNFETIYLAVISLPWATSSEEKIELLACQIKDGETMKNLSFSFHERLFENMLEPYIVLQNCTRSNSSTSSMEDNVDYNDEICSKQCPFELDGNGCCGRIEMTAGIIFAIKRNGKHGFVFGAISSNEDVVVGVEDLRFLQFIQSNLEEALTKFVQQFQERKKFPFKGNRLSHLNERPNVEKQNENSNEEDKLDKKGSSSNQEEQNLKKINQKSSSHTPKNSISTSQSNPHLNRQASIVDSIMNTIEETSYEVRTQNGSSGDWTSKEENWRKNTPNDSSNFTNTIIGENEFNGKSVGTNSSNKSQKIIDLTQTKSLLNLTNESKDFDTFTNSQKSGLQPVPRKNRPRAFTTVQGK